jgi:hypothetical protein
LPDFVKLLIDLLCNKINLAKKRGIVYLYQFPIIANIGNISNRHGGFKSICNISIRHGGRVTNRKRFVSVRRRSALSLQIVIYIIY